MNRAQRGLESETQRLYTSCTTIKTPLQTAARWRLPLQLLCCSCVLGLRQAQSFTCAPMIALLRVPAAKATRVCSKCHFSTAVLFAILSIGS